MRKFYFLIFIFLKLIVLGQVKVNLSNSDSLINKSLSDSNWLYSDVEDVNFYIKEFDDKNWKKSRTNLRENEIKKLNFKGFAWFRKHIFIDTLFKNTPLVLSINQKGASEIYLNGLLIKKIGVIGKTKDDEEFDNGKNLPIFINPKYGADNVIAIKYSNKLYEKSYGQNGEIFAGFNIEIESSGTFYEGNMNGSVITSLVLLALTVFFISIALVHFLLFVFYTERKSNLYFTLFCILFGFYFFNIYLTELIVTDIIIVHNLNFFVIISIPFFMTLLVTNLYSLFYTKFPKQHKIFLVSSTLVSILSIITPDANAGSIILGVIILIEVIRVVIVALKNKIKGAKIIGAGFGLFTFFVLAMIFSVIFFGGFNVAGNLLLFLMLIASLISIPISMSVFLAWDFSQTNKNLKQQLVKNEELSAQTIAQEKEKQELLANQNKLLEEQVEERTLEINEQKKELQLKNVEITDSINYSKHIQLALLPEEEDIKNALPGSFILYQPKDIVSGDFYWFKELDKSAFNTRNSLVGNSSVLIAAADCTGHGVPGALMSLIAIENLNKAVEFENEPHKILELVNKNIKNALKQNTEKGAKDGMDIALCKIEQISETNFKVSYSAANRPLWIVRKVLTTELVEVASINSANKIELIEIKATKTAIGGHTDYNRQFEQHSLEFKKGDSIYIFSDGYADQFGSNKNKKLTTKRFKELLIEINDFSPEQQKQHLLNYILNWKGKLEQIDDILVIGLKF